MPASSNITLSIARSDAAPVASVAGVPLLLRPHPRARRLKLRFDERGGELLLTVPPRLSRRTAIAWAAAQRPWVEAQLARRPAAIPLEPGMVIPLEGESVRLEWVEGASRAVARTAATLSCGGPRENFARRIEQWLRARARAILSEETAENARRAGVEIRLVSVGDAASRWGSCSSTGSIRYSWRLLLMPPAARRYVVAHEVAHRRHMDHGPAFKALERELFDGDVTSARLLLRRFAPIVRRVGRNG